MAKQALVWTALPNGYSADGGSLRLSVLLAPRLDPQPQPGTPSQLDLLFPDWEDWPLTLSQARFDVSFNGQTVSVPATATSGLNRVDGQVGLADSAVWKAIFRATTPVTPFKYTDLSTTKLLSYGSVELTEYIKRLYGALAKSAGDDLPLISDLIATDGWRDLVSIVSQIDTGSVHLRSGLRDPRLEFAAFRDGAAEEERGIVDTFRRFKLFHTPPATPVIRQGPRKDDKRIGASWLEYKQSPLPDREHVAETLDFHQLVSAMGSYPTLLRRLGLVVDLLLDPASFAATAAADLSVSVAFAAGALAVPRTSDGSAATRTRLDATHFDSVSSGATDMPVRGGLLDLAAGFELLPFDIDGAGLKVMNFARSLGRRFDGTARVDPVTRHEDQMGAPALRTSGLMLVRRQRRQALRQRLVRNNGHNVQLEKQLAGTAVTLSLHAEDLVRGYRFDVWDSTSGKWRSLCQRHARYDLLGDGSLVVTADEESTIRLAATKSSDAASNADIRYLHEALVTWSGWSLGAPPPGRAIMPDDTVDKSTTESEAVTPPGLTFTSKFRAVKGTLPRLRFGRSYWMRARAVDLAGNSLAPSTADLGDEQPLDRARPYLRYEPVAAPVIALLSTAGTVAKPGEGESMARMAIRSFNDTPADNVVLTSQVAVRAAAPPLVSAREAEHHGRLDTLGKVDATLFDLLANQKDVEPKHPMAAIREVVLPMQGPLDDSPVPTTFAVYEAGRALTYLPDPLAVEVAARVFDHPNIADTEIIRIPLYPAGDWPEARPFTIEVYDDALAAPSFDADTRRLRVPLPKGGRARVRLSMSLEPGALETLGIFRLLDDADRDAQRERALSGQHWMLTPAATIEVVHAVQRPLVAPAVTTLAIIERQAGQTSARPFMFTSCSVDSTDRLDLHGEWHEPVDSPPAGTDQTAPADRRRHDIAFQVKVTAPRDYADGTTSLIAGGWPEHTFVGPNLIGINQVDDVRLPVKAHEFHDTRYRRIEYWFDATTRFREYLPASVLTKLEGGKPVPTDEHILVTGPRSVTWVPSSAPPPAPRVLYVVPTFGWSRNVDEHGILSSWRRGGGLRVYLDRGWNASGYGEMLAVVLPPSGFAGDPEHTPGAAPYKHYVTQWGNDPIWSSASVAGLAPDRSQFPRARTAPDATGAWLPPGAPPTEADQRPGGFKVTGLQPPSPSNNYGFVDVAPHDVFFDADRGLWYCDIEVSAGSSYFPFIRLALARYQPTSSPRAHLSNVVLADIIALTADRWLNVTPAPEGKRVRAAVFGVTYDESSAHHEAREAVAVSVIDPLTGTVDTREPVMVAQRTVVEVWVEQLEPRWGDDFGWQRLTSAVVQQRVPVPSSGGASAVTSIESILGRPVSAAERLTAGTLLTDADRLGVSPQQVSLKVNLWQTLWEGDVTLPEAPETRHRLVVAEYEEYLVDDAHPYDRTPTRKGRRLVFVEHIELQ